VKPIAGLLAGAVLASGCVAAPASMDRTVLLRRIVPSAVQLRAERDGGGRRSASGVVIASDGDRRRSWILTARHFLEPGVRQRVTVTGASGEGRPKATVSAVSEDTDLAVIEVEGLVLPPVGLQDTAHLGDEVWVVAFPWGRRLTVASGIVSQIATEDGTVALEGPVRQVDALASYGASGGGVFDAVTGRLLGIVEGYRTARVALPTEPARTLDVPVPGETTVLPATAIRRFLSVIGLEPRAGD
jgi:S1-C subfamily serine protease